MPELEKQNLVKQNTLLAWVSPCGYLANDDVNSKESNQST